MDKILILVSNKNNQILLEKELCNRYSIVLPNQDLQLLEFDLIIIDGVELTRKHKEIAALKNKSFPLFLPVLLITTKEEVNLARKFLYETVDELLKMPVDKVELRVRLDILLRARYYTYLLAEETILDPLTGAYNRRYLYEIGQKEMEDFIREGIKFSIILIDIDNFKKN